MDMQALKFDLVSTSFLNHLTIERGLSVHTIAAYRRDLVKFESFLNGRALGDVDPQTISDFEVSLKTAQASPASISRINSTLRSFFKFAMSEFGIANPTFEMAPTQSKRRLPKALTIDQIMALITAAYRESEPITLRDQAMIELLYSSGARVSELVGVNIADIASAPSSDGEITTLKLRGKGSKERIVPLGSFATKAITDYLVAFAPCLQQRVPKLIRRFFLTPGERA